MLLRHPLDHEDDQADRERIVAEDFRADRFRRADHFARDREAADERFMEALEQVDVLRFLAGKVDQCPDPPVVAAQRGPRVVEQEGQDELFDDAEDTKVLMRADLVEDALLERVQASDRRRPGKAVRHEVAREVQFLVFAQDVIELPLRAERRGERRFVVEVMVHDLNPSLFLRCETRPEAPP